MSETTTDKDRDLEEKKKASKKGEDSEDRKASSKDEDEEEESDEQESDDSDDSGDPAARRWAPNCVVASVGSGGLVPAAGDVGSPPIG